MVGPERLLTEREAALVERFGLGIPALALVQRREVVQRAADVGMVGSERFLAESEAALVERLGFGMAALVPVQLSQIGPPRI